MPKQLLQTFYGYQLDGHHCRKQETLRFASEATTKTDDTIVYHNDIFYRVNHVGTDSLTLIKIRTRQLNTDGLCKLPWTKVGVRLYVEDTEDPPIRVKKASVKAKGILCGNVISSMYPQWLIT